MRRLQSDMKSKSCVILFHLLHWYSSNNTFSFKVTTATTTNNTFVLHSQRTKGPSHTVSICKKLVEIWIVYFCELAGEGMLHLSWPIRLANVGKIWLKNSVTFIKTILQISEEKNVWSGWVTEQENSLLRLRWLWLSWLDVCMCASWWHQWWREHHLILIFSSSTEIQPKTPTADSWQHFGFFLHVLT